MKFTYLICMIFGVIGYIPLMPVSFCEPSGKLQVEEQIKNTILAKDWKENWDTIAKLCGSNEQLTSSPILRAIKGHACLALNRNDESLYLFASISRKEDCQKWKEWANEFAKNDNYVAYYFKGDALARFNDWETALDAFNKALSLKTDWHLALNARGIVYHAFGNISSARGDFKKATESREDFIDAYLSCGTLNVYQCNTSTEDNFNTAKKHVKSGTPPFLVTNGFGCALCGKGQYEKAIEYFNSIPKNSVISPLVQRNILAAKIGQMGKIIEDASDAGMAIKSFELSGSEDGSGIMYIDILEDGTKIIYYRDGTVKIIRPGGQGDGEDDDEEGEKKPEQKHPIKEPTILPELLPPTHMFPNPIPPRLPELERMVDTSTRQTIREIASMSPQKIPGIPGGADSDSKKVGKNKGKWDVSSIYGLLYAVPVVLK